MHLGYSIGVEGVDMLVGDIVVGLRHMRFRHLGVHAFGVQCWGGVCRHAGCWHCGRPETHALYRLGVHPFGVQYWGGVVVMLVVGIVVGLRQMYCMGGGCNWRTVGGGEVELFWLLTV